MRNTPHARIPPTMGRLVTSDDACPYTATDIRIEATTWTKEQYFSVKIWLISIYLVVNYHRQTFYGEQKCLLYTSNRVSQEIKEDFFSWNLIHIHSSFFLFNPNCLNIKYYCDWINGTHSNLVSKLNMGTHTGLQWKQFL